MIGDRTYLVEALFSDGWIVVSPGQVSKEDAEYYASCFDHREVRFIECIITKE